MPGARSELTSGPGPRARHGPRPSALLASRALCPSPRAEPAGPQTHWPLGLPGPQASQERGPRVGLEAVPAQLFPVLEPSRLRTPGRSERTPISRTGGRGCRGRRTPQSQAVLWSCCEERGSLLGGWAGGLGASSRPGHWEDGASAPGAGRQGWGLAQDDLFLHRDSERQ